MHDQTHERPRRTGRRWRRRLALLVVVPTLLVVAGATYADYRLVRPLGRVDGAFAGLHDRPADTDALTLLLIVEDRRSVARHSWLPGGGSPLAVLLVEVPPNGRQVRARALTPFATFPDGRSVAETISSGLPADLVAATEKASGHRVDHLAVVDLAYLRRRSSDLEEVRTTVGTLTPEQAAGRLSRPARTPREARVQLEVLDAVGQGTLHQSFRRHPWELWSALEEVSRNAAVEDGWSALSMASTVLSLRDLRSARIAYELAPLSCARGACALVPAADGGAWSD